MSDKKLSQQSDQLPPGMKRIADAAHHDPFSVLGPQLTGKQQLLRVYNPLAERIALEQTKQPLTRVKNSDFFELTTTSLPEDYRLLVDYKDGRSDVIDDPYRFPSSISDFDLHLFAEGNHFELYNVLGAHACQHNGVKGIRFATWAPAASRVSVIGDFNQWDGRVHPMRNRGQSGVWELFLPSVPPGARYKFEIKNADSGDIQNKQDPYANEFELRPDTASVVSHSGYTWEDTQWMSARDADKWKQAPTSIYEVHPGSWQLADDGGFLNYREIAHRLVEYVSYMGFTHIELLPITEHPLDDSWGYQVTGYFATSSRFGTPDDFRYFVDHCHRSNIGVILDWVPAHFPRDAYSLARYDGSCLYEHEDPRRGEHRDWGTLIFNYGRNEVCNFLIASAMYWLKEFHIDGLRVDAVASMLYHDYSREHGDWLPNQFGGRENLEAVDFLRKLNSATQAELPGTVIIAEESTSWPGVTAPPDSGGLGFNMKWNMGWMHDTLSYLAKDPVHRCHHQNDLTFGVLYLHSENFVLPFSHDEVVHGKGSMLQKMPGDEWQRFANLRLLYSYQFTYPGKKLLFQGCEFAQHSEWNFKTALDWHLTDVTTHRGVMQLVRDLNQLYKSCPELHLLDFDAAGFQWVWADDAENSVLSYRRHSDTDSLIVILNFTPVPRENYLIGIDENTDFLEIFNSDSRIYGGSNIGNSGICPARSDPAMGRPYSLSVTLPPLAAIVLKRA
jgi:1,4-alpha-glucan branching enzyme